MGSAPSRKAAYSASTTAAPDAEGRPALARGAVLSLASVGPSLLLAAYDSGFVSTHVSPWADAFSVSPPPLRAWAAHGERPVTAIASGGGLTVTASRDAALRVWRADAAASWGAAPTPPLAGTLSGHTLSVSAVDVWPDGTTAMSGSRDCSVRLWDVSAAREVAAVATPQNVVTCIQRVGDALVAQGGEDLCVRLWDVRALGGGCAAATLKPAASVLGGYTYFPVSPPPPPPPLPPATTTYGRVLHPLLLTSPPH